MSPWGHPCRMLDQVRYTPSSQRFFGGGYANYGTPAVVQSTSSARSGGDGSTTGPITWTFLLLMALEFCGARPRGCLSALGGSKGGVNTRSDVRTAPRLHSSDDGLFLAASTLRRLVEQVQHLAISAHSISEPRIDDEQSISRVGAFRRGRSLATAT
jgi:hypothetical protein